MKFVLNVVFLLILLPTHAETVLRFRTPVTSDAKQVGDLLLITPDKHQWRKIKLDSQPTPGARLEKQKLLLWLQKKTGAFSYQWEGKNTAIIHQNTCTKARELINKAQIALMKKLNESPYAQIELSSKTVLKDSDIPLANFEVQLPEGYPVAKRVCVRLVSQKHSIPIWFGVKAYQQVLVAQRTIKHHTFLQATDLHLKQRDIAGLHGKPLTHLPSDAWLSQPINKHQILTEECLGTSPLVMQGYPVHVTVEQHGIAIIIEAIAQHHGGLGQRIRMKNPRTNKYFVATVTGKNKAEITA